MTSVVMRGDVLSTSGYANTNRLYALGLIRNGIDVKIVEQHEDKENYLINFNKDDADLLREAIDKPIPEKYIYFNRTTVDSFKPYPNAIKTFISSVWEVDPIPSHWLQILQEIDADGIIVPSEFNKRMIYGKINKPIHIIREGVDLSLFKDMKVKENNNETFKFLSIFQWLPRKGYDVLLEAYFKEFNENDNVALVIKTSSLNYSVIPSSQILGSISHIKRKFKKNIPVYVLPTSVKYNKILDLYRECDAYVQPSRAEGYCRPLLEAMASGLPAIATGWGGQTDFANNNNAYLLDYDLVPVDKQWYTGDFQPDQVWGNPSVEHLQRLMREVYENRDVAKHKAKLAKQLTMEYDYKKIAKDLANVLFN